MSNTFRVFALILLLVISLLASAPARLLGLVLPAREVSLQGFSGTLWHGRVSRCLVKTGAGYLQLGAVGWRLDPWSLLLLAPRLNLDSTWGNQTLAGEVVLRGEQDLDLSGFEATIAADLMRQFVPVSLGGVISIQLEQLQLRAGLPVQGAGRLVWQNGAWLSPSGPVSLGSYALDFSQAPGTALEGEVLTLGGPVSAAGTVQLQDRTYSVDITVQGEGPLDERLQQALSLVARPVGQGYRIKLGGEFQEL